MTAQQSPESVLSDISGWEQASVTPLTGGLTNRSYLVEKDGRRAVLKIDDETRGLPFNTRAEERQVQSIAANHALAGRVLHVAERAYLCEYIEGRVWSRADLASDDKLRLLATALKALHALPLTGRTFDFKDAVLPYMAKIDQRDVATARRFADLLLARSQPPNLCCCHNDLVVENIIATPALQFLDWEYACDNDPFFDIATLITHHDLTDAQASLFLNSYFDGDGERWQAQLRAQMFAYDALHWLWLASQPNNDANRILLDTLASRLDFAEERRV